MGIGISYDRWQSNSYDSLPPVILAAGPEDQLKEEFIRKINEDFPESDRETVRLFADEISPSELLQELQGRGLFQEKKLVQLERLDRKEGGTRVLKSFYDTLEDYIEDPEEDVVLVLQDQDHPYQSGRLTGKLADRVEEAGGWAITFWEPFDRELKKKVKKRITEAGKTIRPDALQLLLEKTDGKYARAIKETEKLTQLDADEITREFVASVTSREGAEDSYDALRESLASGDLTEANRRLANLWRRQEPPVKVFRIVLDFLEDIRAVRHRKGRGESLENALSEVGIPTSKSVKKRYKRALQNLDLSSRNDFYRDSYKTEKDTKYVDKTFSRLRVEEFVQNSIKN